MHRVIAVVLTVTVQLSLAAPLLAQQWSEHQPADLGYRIEFPGRPTLSAEDVPTLAGPIRMFIAEVGRGHELFLVLASERRPHPATSGPEPELERVANSYIARNNRRVREDRRLSFGDAPARRLVLEDPQQGTVLTIVIVLGGTHMYQVSLTAPPGGESSLDAQRFFSSFALVPR